jgi:Fic family protein
MRKVHFGKKTSGELVPITVDERGTTIRHVAFVPHALPADFKITSKSLQAMFNASTQLGRLNAIAEERLPNPTLLVRPTVRLEAISTSAIEGTITTMSEIMRSDTDDQQPRNASVTEVLNFVRATEHAIKRLTSLPLGIRFASELHEILMAGTPGADWQMGKVRRTQVYIGSKRGRGVRDATYVPPPPGEMLRDRLAQWEKWLHADPDIHPLVKVAAAHYQFEALHPFTDGNGRIGRLLAMLQIVDLGLLSDPLVNLSPYFEKRSDEYRQRLYEVSTKGAWDEWITFFCNAVADQAFIAEVRIRALTIWRDATLEKLRKKHVKGVSLAVTTELISRPTVTVKTIALRHKVTLQSANLAVARLAQLGILKEITGKKHGRMFEAPDVFNILSR